MTNVPAGVMFLKDPIDWTVPDGVSCLCRSVGVGIVHEVHPGASVAVAGAGGAIPGLTAEETAILAGVLVGLATLLFLLLPILCCLCPFPCAICGKKGAAAAGAGAHGHTARKGSDAESFWSRGSWGAQDKMDYENLYGVDMKLPRPWYDSQRGGHFDSKLRGMENDGWEGVDMTRDEIDVAARAGGGDVGETVAQTGLVTYAAQEQGGSSMGNGGVYSTVDRNRSAAGGAGGDEVITEYATTRRLDISVGGMSQDEAERYYTKEYQPYLPRLRKAGREEFIALEQSTHI